MGLLIPATLPQLIVEVVKVAEIGLKRPATLYQLVMEVGDVGQVLPATIPLIITEDMLIEVDLVHNRPSTLFSQ